MTIQNEVTKGVKPSAKPSTPKRTHRDCKITIIVFATLIIVIIILALIFKYTDWFPSEGTLAISIDNSIDENVTFELYIGPEHFQSGVIEPGQKLKFETKLEEGRYTVTLNAVGSDFDYYLHEDVKIYSGERTWLPFYILEWEIPYYIENNY
jgi:hypothetical protein